MTPLERKMLKALRASVCVLSGEAMSKSTLIEALELGRDCLREAATLYPNEVPSQHPKESHAPTDTNADARA